MKASDVRGIIVPVVTPITDDDQVDHEGLRRAVRHVLAGGVHGVFALGGTGNFPSFTADERFAIARTVVEEVARRIALHIVPIAAVADVGLVVLGGGIGANGDLLLGPIRGLLERWLPYPPRVEVSSLGEAAVLTGALAIGLQTAQDNVFANRRAVAVL